MLHIWEKFVENKKKIDPSLSIKEVYAKQQKVKPSWIQDPAGLSIQEWIDQCCDKLEAEGYDLNVTDVSLVKEKFVLYDISIVPPIEYKQLQKALNQANKTLEMLSNFDANENMIDQIRETIRILTLEMKELS